MSAAVGVNKSMMVVLLVWATLLGMASAFHQLGDVERNTAYRRTSNRLFVYNNRFGETNQEAALGNATRNALNLDRIMEIYSDEIVLNRKHHTPTVLHNGTTWNLYGYSPSSLAGKA